MRLIYSEMVSDLKWHHDFVVNIFGQARVRNLLQMRDHKCVGVSANFHQIIDALRSVKN